MGACCALYSNDMDSVPVREKKKKSGRKEGEERWKHDLADFCGEPFLLEKEGGRAEKLEEGALTL